MEREGKGRRGEKGDSYLYCQSSKITLYIDWNGIMSCMLTTSCLIELQRIKVMSSKERCVQGSGRDKLHNIITKTKYMLESSKDESVEEIERQKTKAWHFYHKETNNHHIKETLLCTRVGINTATYHQDILYYQGD